MNAIFPAFVGDAQFWLLLVPLVVAAFFVGLVIRPSRVRLIGRPGMGSLLGNVSDEAILLLEKSTDELKPETLGTYLALGNLFRNRGQFDRATRIHQSLAGRTDAPTDLRLGARIALGLDYIAAGLMDRAEDTLRNVMDSSGKSTPEHAEALDHLAKLLERQQRWPEALEVRTQLGRTSRHDPAAHGHLLWRMAAEAHKAGDTAKARDLLEKAIATHPGCLPAWRMLAEMDVDAGNTKAAISTLEKALEARPELFHLLEDVMQKAFATTAGNNGLQALWEKASLHPKAHWRTSAGYARWLESQGERDEALSVLKKVYTTSPNLLETADALSHTLQDMGAADEALAILHTHLAQKQKTLMAYQCRSCGFSSQKIFWHCPQCHHWDSVAPISMSRRAA